MVNVVSSSQGQSGDTDDDEDATPDETSTTK